MCDEGMLERRGQLRNRAAVIVIEEGHILLIKRVWSDSLYYVLPGGGIEGDETPETAAKREAFEETGLNVAVQQRFAVLEDGRTQFFFLATKTGGLLGSGSGREYTDSNRNRGTYEPMWIELDVMGTLDIRPAAVALKIHDFFVC